jgi:hypothetical protein
LIRTYEESYAVAFLGVAPEKNDEEGPDEDATFLRNHLPFEASRGVRNTVGDASSRKAAFNAEELRGVKECSLSERGAVRGQEPDEGALLVDSPGEIARFQGRVEEFETTHTRMGGQQIDAWRAEALKRELDVVRPRMER